MFDTQKIADAYDQIALNFSATRVKLSAEVTSLLPPLTSSDKILDLGCGNGVLLTSLPPNSNYLGLDISNALINEAKRTYPHQDFVLSDVTKPESWSKLETYDFIAALSLLHHLPTQKSLEFVASQIARHLKPGGHLHVSVWRLDQEKFKKYQTGDHLTIPFHGGVSRDFRVVTEKEISKLFNAVGLKVVKTSHTKDNYNFLLVLKF